MKKNKSIPIILIIVFSIVAISVFIVYFLVFPHVLVSSDVKGLFQEAIKAFVITIPVGIVATCVSLLITNHYLSIKKNDDRLRKMGIQRIGMGKSSNQAILNTFGNPNTGAYPKNIKIMFITGDNFFIHFKDRIVKSIAKGNCMYQILLASDDCEHLQRLDEMCKQPDNNKYADQLITTLDVLKQIVEELGDKYQKNIEVRFYQDQYRYNFRVATYSIDSVNGSKIERKYCHWNVQPFNENSIDHSIALISEWDEDESTEPNSFLAQYLEVGFDDIWEKSRQEDFRTYTIKKED